MPDFDIDQFLNRAPGGTVVFLGAGAGMADGVASTAGMASEIRTWLELRLHPTFVRLPEVTAFLRRGDPETLAALASVVERERIESNPVASLLYRRLTWAAAVAADHPHIGLDGYRKALLENLQLAEGRLDILTTNWDTSLDSIVATLADSKKIDYMLNLASTGRMATTRGGTIRLFKLNGSPRWVTCEKCHMIYDMPYTVGLLSEDEASYHGISETFRSVELSNEGEANIPYCSKCELQATHVLTLPSIGPALNYMSLEVDMESPGLSQDQAQVLHLHSEAALAVMSAHRIVFVGYSLPPYDRAIRLLLDTALKQSSIVAAASCQITVVAKGDMAEATRQNFAEFFGEIPFAFRDDGIDGFLANACSNRSAI